MPDETADDMPDSMLDQFRELLETGGSVLFVNADSLPTGILAPEPSDRIPSRPIESLPPEFGAEVNAATAAVIRRLSRFIITRRNHGSSAAESSKAYMDLKASILNLDMVLGEPAEPAEPAKVDATPRNPTHRVIVRSGDDGFFWQCQQDGCRLCVYGFTSRADAAGAAGQHGIILPGSEDL